jgi:hypothetical protein
MTWYVGQQPKITATFKANNVLTNPTSNTVTVIAPDGSSSTPTASNESTGIYAFNLSLTMRGRYHIKWSCTGAVVDSAQEYIDAEHTIFD